MPHVPQVEQINNGINALIIHRISMRFYHIFIYLNFGHRISTRVLLIFRLHIQNLHAGIKLDYNQQCIYIIFCRVRANVKIVTFVAQVAQGQK